MSLIKSKLIQNITEANPHLFVRDVERIVNTIFNEITQSLAEGKRVEFNKFVPWSLDEVVIQPMPFVTQRENNTHIRTDGCSVHGFNIFQLPKLVFSQIAGGAVCEKSSGTATTQHQMLDCHVVY